jgi:hypothetical protein
VCVWQAPRACSRECPRGHGRDVNATSRSHRVVTAHGKAVVGVVVRHNVGVQLGLTAARRGWGTARPRGAGAHARAQVLASQGRSVAVPCAGLRHPGPAARRGGEG